MSETLPKTSDTQFTAFLTRHRALLTAEREADLARTSLLLSNCSPKLLQQQGLALLGLGVVSINIGLGGKTLVELDRPSAYHTSPEFPPHSLRPGDLARIEENVTGKPGKAKPSAKSASTSEANGSNGSIEGVVYKVSETKIVVAVDSAEVDVPERCRVLKLANTVTYDRMDRALDSLERIVIPNSDSNAKPVQEMSPLIRVLLGYAAPSPLGPKPEITFFDSSLNPSQKEAVYFTLQAHEVACIHGPPGTGKTHTLIEIIRQLATSCTPSAGEISPKPPRILVCGASNLAVDNILERILALPGDPNTPKLKVTRIGHPARVLASNESVLGATLDLQAARSDEAALAKDIKEELDTLLTSLSGRTGKNRPRGAERKKMWEEVKALRKEYRQRESAVVKSVLSEAQIVFATCHSSGGRQLQGMTFDIVIIDEATQALEAVCWVPLLHGARKLILAGDPMQLPPTVLALGHGDRKAKAKNDSKAKPKEKGVPKTQAKDSTKSKSSSTGASKASKVKGTEPAPSSSETASSADADSQSGSELEAAVTGQKAPPNDKKSTSSRKMKTEKKKDFVPSGLIPPRTLETTLFDRLERMYGPSIKRMLEVQYRMHTQICEFPSKALYSSKLSAHDSVASHLLRDLSNVSEAEDEDAILSTPMVFFDTAGCEYFERLEGQGEGGSTDAEGSKCNENEAVLVKTWIDKLTSMGILTTQIAVISPYQAQVTLLSTLLRPEYPDLEIGTVDGMQGREKEAIVISLVRSNDKREVGFLKEKRRLNVAMTRARRHLCVVGDSSTIEHGGTYLKRWLKWLEDNADVRYAGID